jgi:hypothetical protein
LKNNDPECHELDGWNGRSAAIRAGLQRLDRRNEGATAHGTFELGTQSHLDEDEWLRGVFPTNKPNSR